MGYRLHLDCPSPEDFKRIFADYVRARDLSVDESLVDSVVERYQQEERDLRASEPRDLIERALDICRLRGQDAKLDQDILNTAWRGYFGNVAQ